jgi:hypothetical protein
MNDDNNTPQETAPEVPNEPEVPQFPTDRIESSENEIPSFPNDRFEKGELMDIIQKIRNDL